jgi:adenylate kinase
VSFFEEVLLNSDVIIYDLNQCDLKEAEFVISTLKLHPFNEQKILICISNVMTWATTPPREKKEGEEEEGDENPPEEADSEEEGAPEPAEGEEKKVYTRFSDKDYALRKPALAYEKIKSIETLCLAAGSVKPNLKTYVVCSGLLYG